MLGWQWLYLQLSLPKQYICSVTSKDLWAATSAWWHSKLWVYQIPQRNRRPRLQAGSLARNSTWWRLQAEWKPNQRKGTEVSSRVRLNEGDCSFHVQLRSEMRQPANGAKFNEERWRSGKVFDFNLELVHRLVRSWFINLICLFWNTHKLSSAFKPHFRMLSASRTINKLRLSSPLGCVE